MDIEGTSPEGMGAAIADALESDVDYEPVASDGAAHAARLIAELV
jgi:flavin-binding protein dodecin